MKHAQKIKLVPFIKFQTFFWGLLGVSAGVFYAFGGLIIDTAASLGWVSFNETPGLGHGTLLAFGALIVMPLLFALFGLLTAFVGALLFNAFSKWLGWINLNFK